MKCAKHQLEAIGVCAYCGRALCAECGKDSDPGAARMVCSERCAAALAKNDRAMALILQKSVQNSRASALYCFLCAGLSAAGAVGAWFYLRSQFLIAFCAGCALVFAASGIWYGRIAGRSDERD